MRYVLMFTLMVAMTGLAGVGCSSMSHKKATTEMSEVDDCPMCPGVQHANADGTCPKCGMKVKG